MNPETELDDFLFEEESEGHQDCPSCGREYDEIDIDYQICSKCGWDAELKTRYNPSEISFEGTDEDFDDDQDFDIDTRFEYPDLDDDFDGEGHKYQDDEDDEEDLP
jgi:ribosomal protein L37E